MKPALAIFDLGEFDELSATLCDIETREVLGRVDDDPQDRAAFQDQVKAAAKALGLEVIEWDRAALAALA